MPMRIKYDHGITNIKVRHRFQLSIIMGKLLVMHDLANCILFQWSEMTS